MVDVLDGNNYITTTIKNEVRVAYRKLVDIVMPLMASIMVAVTTFVILVKPSTILVVKTLRISHDMISDPKLSSNCGRQSA